MGSKHYQTVDTPKKEPQVGRGTVWYPSSNSSLQISIFQILQIFIISYFPNLTYPLRKSISFPKFPKITQTFTQNRQTVVNGTSIEIQRCLKYDRDIGRKAVLSDVETAFTCTPAFIGVVLRACCKAPSCSLLLPPRAWPGYLCGSSFNLVSSLSSFHIFICSIQPIL